MDREIIDNCLEKYCSRFESFYTGSIGSWIQNNIEFCGRYALSHLNIDLSPYLIEPFAAIKDPSIFIVSLAAAPQTCKTMMAEGTIFYWLLNDPAAMMRLHPNEQLAKDFAETRFLPTVRGNSKLYDLMGNENRYSISANRILFPNAPINFNGPGLDGALLHGYSLKYLLADEVHIMDDGLLEKAEARTIAYAGRGRKMIITSQPNKAGSEYHKYYQRGSVWQWQWKCPKCNKYQPYQLAKERPDGTFAGFNCERIIKTGTDPIHEIRDIAMSARTTWLECEYCCHRVEETPSNRRNLNDDGKYICIKDGGDSQCKSFTWPIFVNPNISFESQMVKYFESKRQYDIVGVKDDYVNFINQSMGEFYKADKLMDISQILVTDYDVAKDWPQEKYRFMTVDYQKINYLKYWLIRAWDGNGNSRLLDLGIARTWGEIKSIQKKWHVKTPCVGIDCGFSGKQQDESIEVFSECIKYGEMLLNKDNKPVRWLTWIALRGSGETSFKHDDGIKFYSKVTKGNPNFPVDNKFRGLGGCDRYVWANWPIKNILMNLRDNKYSGVSWTTNIKDVEYERHLYSEKIQVKLDRRTNMPKEIWTKQHEDNHWLDCECENLVLSMMAGTFTTVGLDVEKVLKDVGKIEKPGIPKSSHGSS